jgi:phosphomannomutase
MKYIFDVDGVLCDTGETIDPEFRAWFIEWSKDKEYYILTGGNREATMKQIGPSLVKYARAQFHCMGNHVFIEDREYKLNQFTLRPEEYMWLHSYVQDSPYQIKTGNHIEQRTGSLNVSIVGRNATKKERSDYIQWDNIYHEREKLAYAFVKQFPRFEAYLGGNTSIDICLQGANKGRSLILIHNFNKRDAVFFGDKCMKGGIDSTVLPHVATHYQINNGYKETWEILKTL